MSSNASKGFTLIELMITLVIIGILSSIALPSYQEYIARGRRADAQTQLLAAQLWLERYYSVNFRYDQDSGGTAVNLSNQPFSESPAKGSGSGKSYGITVSAARNSYTLTATRSGNMANDKCGNFTLSNTGVKALASKPTGSTATLADCWK